MVAPHLGHASHIDVAAIALRRIKSPNHFSFIRQHPKYNYNQRSSDHHSPNSIHSYFSLYAIRNNINPRYKNK